MRSAGVVKAKVAGERLPCFGYRIVGLEVYLLVLDGSPEPLHEHIVAPSSSTVHADGDRVAGQQAGERRAGELAALIGVEDLRLTVMCHRLLYCSHAATG